MVAACKQIREFFCSVSERFVQRFATSFSVSKRGYGCHGCRTELSPQIFMEIRTKSHVLQLVRLVPSIKRAVAQTGHEP